jgi:hypothetical protein
MNLNDFAYESAKVEEREHSLIMHVFSISAGMVGVCLTGIGLLRVLIAQTKVATIGDDLIAIDALVFMVCCLLSFWSFKMPQGTRQRALRWVIDFLFLSALVLMVAVCGVIAYAIG